MLRMTFLVLDMLEDAVSISHAVGVCGCTGCARAHAATSGCIEIEMRKGCKMRRSPLVREIAERST